MFKQSNSYLRIIRYLLIVVLIVLSISVFIYHFFAYDVQKKFSNETNTYLGEIADQSVLALQNQIRGETKTMQDLASFIGANTQMNREEILSVLSRICDNNGFKRMGIIAPNGTAYTTDHQTLYLQDRNYFKESMKGKALISDTLIDYADGLDIHVYSAPIYREGNIIGVIFATHKIELYQKILSISTFNNKGSSFIAKKNGEVLIKSENLPNGEIKNISEIVDIEKIDGDGKSIKSEEVIHNMIAGKKGIVKFTYDNETNYMNYTPLKINDWYLISIVPERLISEKTNYITKRTLYLYSIIIAAYSLLVIYIIYVQRTNKKELSVLAYIDPLTGAPNINKFNIEVKGLLEKNKNNQCAIVHFDIEQFKYINDMLGFDKGNEILCCISKILEENLGEDEFFARVQSDNFVLLLTFENKQQLESKIDSLYDEFCQIHEGNQNPSKLNFSCGVYIVDDFSIDITTMIDRASIARKTVKGQHQSLIAFYNNDIRKVHIEEKEIENMMFTALEKKEFVVFLQPKYELKMNSVIGAEALVRWQHPEKGLIQPFKFIPLFEKNGFIIDLDYYVFEETCMTIKKWIDQGKNSVPISVNMSRLHINEAGFVDRLKGIVEKYQIPAGLIEIELTENIFFNNSESILSIMRELQELGFLISLDDFGTGYSSLNMLKDIPVDILKLDRKFFSDTNDLNRGEKVVTGVVKMAKELSIKIVSEGVETEGQVKFLKEVGCDMAQGYYFAKPMPIQEFEELTH